MYETLDSAEEDSGEACSGEVVLSSQSAEQRATAELSSAMVSTLRKIGAQSS